MSTQVNKTKRKDTMLVDPRNILFNEDNVRRDLGDIDELMNSIIENGLEVAVKAKKVRGTEEYLLVDGHRRLTAIKKAIEQGHDIPYVEVVPYNGNDEDAIFSMVITGTGQKALTEMEQAEAFKKLVGLHYKPEEIAKRVGKSVPYVYNMLTLANAPKEIRDKVHDGEVSGGTVVQIVKQTSSATEQVEIVKDAIADAQKNGKKKATAQNVPSLKAKTPIQKLNELIEKLNERPEKSEFAEDLLDILCAFKIESVEEILERVK